jgi:hypothetical protein
MTLKEITLESIPTQLEKVKYLQKIINQIINFNLFSKIVKNFNSNPNQTYFDYIQNFLETFIDLTGLNVGARTTLCLVDSNGKIIIYFNGTTFSTYANYISNLRNLTRDEQQEYLFFQPTLEKDEKDEKDGKVSQLYGSNVFVGQTNVCYGYNLVAFSYINGLSFTSMALYGAVGGVAPQGNAPQGNTP